jgi:hypothetical protein
MRIAAVVLLLLVAHWFLLRPVLKDRWQEVKKLEGLSLWARLRILWKGWKSLMWGRFLMFAGAALPYLQLFDVIDLTSFLKPITLFGVTVGPELYGPLTVSPLLGWINNKLRHATDGPVKVNTFELESPAVAVPDAPATAPGPSASEERLRKLEEAVEFLMALLRPKVTPAPAAPPQ